MVNSFCLVCGACKGISTKEGEKEVGKTKYLLPAQVRVMLVRESPSSDVIICGLDDVKKVLGDYFAGMDREVFVCVHLNNRSTMLGVETVSMGSLNASIVHPREVFKGAILNNAASIITAHNHPSGDPEPSEDDLKATKKLEYAGKLLEIPLLDHVIFGDKVYSFKDEGIMSGGKGED